MPVETQLPEKLNGRQFLSLLIVFLNFIFCFYIQPFLFHFSDSRQWNRHEKTLGCYFSERNEQIERHTLDECIHQVHLMRYPLQFMVCGCFILYGSIESNRLSVDIYALYKKEHIRCSRWLGACVCVYTFFYVETGAGCLNDSIVFQRNIMIHCVERNIRDMILINHPNQAATPSWT